MSTHWYITTPIYYVNDRPHIGHCYTTLVADCMARFQRLAQGAGPWKDGAGGGVFFLTGTDEHADKVVTSAAAHGMTTMEWADRNAAEFAAAFGFFGTSHDDFIRTTQERHKAKVTEYVSALMKSGDIYKGEYEGWYDENQEEYLTETAAKDANFVSPVNGKPLVRRSETCYFFRLSAYQKKLEELFAARPGFVRPEARRNEVLGRLREGLQDVPVSRPVTDDPATQFGIRVPGDEKHRIYVWIDALFNYLSTVDTDGRRALWPPRVHYIAKDILWFHAVIWPAMLLALRGGGGRFGFVELPACIYSHAYWVRDGRKMSKSLGNFVTIEVLKAYADRYSLDAVRWYMLTQGPLGQQDADFSHAKFVEVYNADLANGVGNCASRVANMIEKYFEGKTPALTPWASEWFASRCAAEVERAAALAADLQPDGALRAGMGIITKVDDLISEQRPFTLAKDMAANGARVAEILAACAEAVRIASVLLSPAMPGKMAKLWEAWNCAPAPGATLADLCRFGGGQGLKAGGRISKGEALFMRADPAENAPA